MRTRALLVMAGACGAAASGAQAKEEAALPRVLIIGDSISLGYTRTVVDSLRGKAIVKHAPGNNAGTTKGMESLKSWLGEGKWDVIHFNWGLHDLKRARSRSADGPKYAYQADIKQYEKNLRVMVPMLKAAGARLIFATTTPFPAGVGKGRLPEDVAKYNAAALKIMKEHKIAIDDLYTFALP